MNITAADALINMETGAYPVYLTQVRKDHENKSFAENPTEEVVAELGYAYVWPKERPQADVVTEGAPTLINGKWTQQWLVRDFTEAEFLAHFQDRKQAVQDRVRALQAATLERGCLYTFPDNSQGRIQLRDGDRANLAGLRLRAEATKRREGTETFGFRTYENVTKLGLSPDEIIVLSDIAFEKYMTILGICWHLKDQADVATTDAQLPAVPPNLDAFGI